jgi:hypothetical protein
MRQSHKQNPALFGSKKNFAHLQSGENFRTCCQESMLLVAYLV